LKYGIDNVAYISQVKKVTKRAEGDAIDE